MTDEERELVSNFISEAVDLSETLMDCIDEMEKYGVSAAVVDQIFRHIHSLKGAGAFIGEFDNGVKAVAQYCHGFENLLNQVRNGARAGSSETRALITEGIAALCEDVERLESGNAPKSRERLLTLFSASGHKAAALTKRDSTILVELKKDLIAWRDINEILTAIYTEIKGIEPEVNLIFDLKEERSLSSQAFGAIFGFCSRVGQVYVANPPQYIEYLIKRMVKDGEVKVIHSLNPISMVKNKGE